MTMTAAHLKFADYETYELAAMLGVEIYKPRSGVRVVSQDGAKMFAGTPRNARRFLLDAAVAFDRDGYFDAA